MNDSRSDASADGDEPRSSWAAVRELWGAAIPSRRIPNLDGLRAYAIIVVVVSHVHPFVDDRLYLLKALLSTGWNGVYLFFVLSGFLVGSLAFKEFDSTGTISKGRFWARRFFRTWPLYFVLLGYRYWASHGVEGREFDPPLWSFLTFTQNFFFPIRAFPQSWSLAVEEQFYLVLPIAILTSQLLGLRRRSILAVAVVIFLTPLIYRGIFFDQTLFASMDSLLIGVALGALHVRRHPALNWAKAHGNLLFVVGLGVVYAPMWLDVWTPAERNILLFCQAIGFGLITAAALSPRLFVGRLLASRPLYFVALVSYSMYLTHDLWLLEVLARGKGVALVGWIDSIVFLAGFLLASIVLGSVFYLAIERPGMALRELAVPRQQQPPRTA